MLGGGLYSAPMVPAEILTELGPGTTMGISDGTADNAGVIAIPPIVYLAGLLLGLVIHYLYPIEFLPESLSVWLAILLILVSIPIALAALAAFIRAKTSMDVRKPTTVVVTDGIFRFSRNPMYIALTLLYSGIGVWVNSLWSVLCLVPVLVAMHQGVIRREERYLEDKFGDEYLRYKSEVRRWIQPISCWRARIEQPLLSTLRRYLSHETRYQSVGVNPGHTVGTLRDVPYR